MYENIADIEIYMLELLYLLMYVKIYVCSYTIYMFAPSTVKFSVYMSFVLHSNLHMYVCKYVVCNWGSNCKIVSQVYVPMLHTVFTKE